MTRNPHTRLTKTQICAPAKTLSSVTGAPLLPKTIFLLLFSRHKHYRNYASRGYRQRAPIKAHTLLSACAHLNLPPSDAISPSLRRFHKLPPSATGKEKNPWRYK